MHAGLVGKFRAYVSKSPVAGVDRDFAALVALILFGAGIYASSGGALAFLLVTVAGVVIIISPVGGAWAVCASLPFVAHPVDIGSAQFTLLEIVTLISAASVGLRIALNPAQLREPCWRRPFLFLLFGGGALVLAAIFSIAFMPMTDHRSEALRLMRWTIVEPLLVFVVMAFAIRQRGALPLLFAIVVPAGLVAVGALGLLLVDPDRFQGDGLARAIGPYLHPNNLALYLERAGVLLAAAILLRGIRLTRSSGLILALIAAGAAVTLSRGMIPAVAAGILLAAWLARDRRVAGVSVALLAAGTVVFVLFAGDRFWGDGSESILGERKYVWQASWEMVRDYPVSGIGLDQFLYQHAPRYIAPEAWSERYLSHPHSILLDSWLSLGIAGVLILAAGLALLAWTVWEWRRSEIPAPPLQAAAVAALVTGVVHGLVDNAYFLPDLAAFTWILAAIVICPSINTAPPP